MGKTPNHSLDTPEKGTNDWHIPLNNNFNSIDSKLPIRDLEQNLGNYSPSQDAKFEATDTGATYHWDGSQWVLTDSKHNAITANTQTLASDCVQAYGSNGNFSETYSVAEYGTIVNAMQTALEDLRNNKGGTLLIGAASTGKPYKLPPDFPGFDIPHRTTVIGQGSETTVFELTGDVLSSVFDLGAPDGSDRRNFGVHLSGIQITSPSDSNNLPLYGGRTAIRGDHWAAGTMTDVKVKFFSGSALTYRRSWDCDLHACIFAHAGDPTNSLPMIDIDGEAGDNANHLTMNQCHLERYHHTGIQMKNDTRKIRIHNTKIHGAHDGSYPAIEILGGGLNWPIPEEISISKTILDLPSSGPVIRITDGTSINMSDIIFHTKMTQNTREGIKIEGGNDIAITEFNIATRRAAHPPSHFGIDVLGGTDIRICNGAIDGEGAASNPPALVAGVRVGPSASGVTVSDVIVRNAAGNGILVEGSRCTVNNCIVYNCGQDPDAEYDGIVCAGTDCNISSNHAYDSRGTSSKTQRYGINDNGDRNMYVGNNLHGNKTAGLSGQAGPNSIINNNIL